jgi:hypothetical protein
MQHADAPGPELFANRCAAGIWSDDGILENMYFQNSGKWDRSTSRTPFSADEDLEAYRTIQGNLSHLKNLC